MSINDSWVYCCLTCSLCHSNVSKSGQLVVLLLCLSFRCVKSLFFFLRLSQNVFSRFSKNTFFKIFSSNFEIRTWKFRASCDFVLKISDKNLRSSWGSNIPLELILYPCSWKSSWALFNRFYGFILFLNSWIFQIQCEEHLRMKYSFRFLGLSWKSL